MNEKKKLNRIRLHTLLVFAAVFLLANGLVHMQILNHRQREQL